MTTRPITLEMAQDIARVSRTRVNCPGEYRAAVAAFRAKWDCNPAIKHRERVLAFDQYDKENR